MYSSRIISLQQEVEGLYEQQINLVSPQKKLDSAPSLFVAPIDLYACCDPTEKKIYLNPLFLIEGFADLPHDFMIDSIEQIQGKEDMYVKKLFDWMKVTFPLDALPTEEATFLELLKRSLPGYIKLWSDPHIFTNPSFASRWKTFVLAHETAHSVLGYPPYMRSFFFITLYISSIFFSYLAGTAFALPSLFSFLLVTAITSALFHTLIFYYLHRTLEKQADLLALKITKDPVGANAFLQSLQSKEGPSFSLFNYHPTAEETIRYLSELRFAPV